MLNPEYLFRHIGKPCSLPLMPKINSSPKSEVKISLFNCT